MELRDYQTKIYNSALPVFKEYGWVYLALEMRLGKTLLAFTLAKAAGCNHVLFVTKKKAIPSIESDFKKLQAVAFYATTITNYESLHKVQGQYDCVIIDEAHSIGQYPKPNNRCLTLGKMIASMERKPKIIYLSGTPTPESYSQMYHQLALLGSRSPWFQYKNFYRWAGKIDAPNYVKIRVKMINGIKMNDYDKANIEKIEADIKPFRITYTQEEAGFTSQIEEQIITLPMPERLQKLFNIVKTDQYYRFKDGEELAADTSVKVLNKLHQISSGTIITESKNYKVLDDYKAQYIRDNYHGKKIAIFYKFISEGEMLRKVFGDRITFLPEEFNQNNHLIFISQIQSGSMGINLSTADILIFFNIDFSATQYYQARARLGSMQREKPQTIHWLFSDIGVEAKVYQAVQKKKSYTVRHYLRDYDGKRSITSGEMYRTTESKGNLLQENSFGKQFGYA